MNSFCINVLGKEVVVNLDIVNSELTYDDKKSWISNVAFGDIEESTWNLIKDQEYLVDIKRCNWTGNLNISICMEASIFSDDISYFLNRICIELGDQILENINIGLSAQTYADLGGFTVLDLKTGLYSDLRDNIVDSITNLVDNSGEEVISEDDKRGEVKTVAEDEKS